MRIWGLLFSLLVSFQSEAGWLDELKEAYNKTRQSNETSSKQQMAELPSDFPDWLSLSRVRLQQLDSQVLVAEAGIKDKSTVLLVHGLGQNGLKDWLTVIPVLAQHYRVVAIDLPGFGYSTAKKGRYSPLTYSQVLAELIQVKGLQSVHLVGHSMGGAVSLMFAAKYPELLSKLVLVDAAGILERTAFVKAISASKVSNSYVTDRLLEFSTELPDPTSLLRRSDTIWNLALGSQENANAALSLVETDFSSLIDKVQTDTHIIWGAEDKVAPLRTGKLLSKQLSNAELHIIKGAGHVPMASHADDFNQKLLYSLKTKVAPSSNISGEALTQDLVCENQSDKVYTGRYRSILIKGCKDISLHKITTSKLKVINSNVKAENLDIQNEVGIGLECEKSMMEVTNMQLLASLPLKLSKCRFDLAGARLEGESILLEVDKRSRVIWSISRAHNSTEGVYLHGPKVWDKGSYGIQELN